MFQSVPREKEWQSWLLFAAWVAFVLRLAPLSRPYIRDIMRSLGRESMLIGSLVVIVVAAIIAARYAWKTPRIKSSRALFWLLASVGVFAYLIVFRIQSAQDSLHFLEYGFMSLLAFRAFSHRVRDFTVCISAALLCGIIGTLDEFIQWLLPGRIWDLNDWLWNLVGAALAQIVIAGGMQPAHLANKPRLLSCRLLNLLLFLQISFISLCLSMTPIRVQELADHFPALGFLHDHEDVMTEYGQRIELPPWGAFRSRLSVEEMQQADIRQGEIAGRIIGAYLRTGGDYVTRMRMSYLITRSPLMVESMQRIGRRNHYYKSAWKHVKNEDRYAYHMLVAYTENAILETCCPRLLAAAGARLEEPDRALVVSSMKITKRAYYSPVGDHLLTAFTEREMRLGVLAALLALLLSERATTRRFNRPGSHPLV